MTEVNIIQQTENLSPKEWVVTIILCFFFGGWGVHRFYVGKVGTGLLMLFTLGGFFIWWFIDLIMIACEAFRDKEGRKIPYSSQPQTSKVTHTISDAKSDSTADQKLDKKIATELRELSSLKEEGILTEAEFDKKKKELLNL